MEVQENYSLKNLNTFGIEVRTRYFASFENQNELKELLEWKKHKHLSLLLLGGGSNLLFTKDYEGLVLQNKIKGLSIEKETSEYTVVKAGAGEIWHDLVLYAIKNKLGGIENLSLIPGTVGAAPIQNIGAYGVELKDHFEKLDAIEIESGKSKSFNLDECCFGYRNSIFKSSQKGKYIITHVYFKLSKKPEFKTSYGAIKDTLQDMKVQEISAEAISKAVIRIRQSKLPDPEIIGNAGSFFKNPEIPEEQFLKLKESNPDIPSYPVTPGIVKVPAGWLNEQCGWKGKRYGNAGVHKDQALVLVNYGNASGKEIQELSQKIQASVLEKFGIKLETEVNII